MNRWAWSMAFVAWSAAASSQDERIVFFGQNPYLDHTITIVKVGDKYHMGKAGEIIEMRESRCTGMLPGGLALTDFRGYVYWQVFPYALNAYTTDGSACKYTHTIGGICCAALPGAL